MVVDYVCGSSVDESTQKSFCYNGRTFYFCSQECLDEFKTDPKLYTPADLNNDVINSRDLKSITSR